jgi:two-component system, cell cycle response regulator CpdR
VENDFFSILVVEDDIAVRDVVIQVLLEKGFAVLAASDAFEALRVLAEHTVDLLFTDILMPSMDGVDLAKQAKLLQPALKVLFATGYAQKAAERNAMRFGRVLFKPVRAPELLEAVQAAAAA